MRTKNAQSVINICIFVVIAVLTAGFGFLAYRSLNVMSSLTPTQVFDKAVKSVVELRASTDGVGTSYGSAVFVNEDGSLVTNAHVACYEGDDGEQQPHDRLSIRFHGEDDYVDVSLVRFDAQADLCLLSYSGTAGDFSPIAIAESGLLDSGDRVYAVGNAMNHGLSISEGIVSLPLINIVLEGHDFLVIQSDITINSGNSGGALLDSSGGLVGITTFRLRDIDGYIIYGVAFSIPSDQLLTYLG